MVALRRKAAGVVLACTDAGWVGAAATTRSICFVRSAAHPSALFGVGLEPVSARIIHTVPAGQQHGKKLNTCIITS
jgi:hypothetical protein